MTVASFPPAVLLREESAYARPLRNSQEPVTNFMPWSQPFKTHTPVNFSPTLQHNYPKSGNSSSNLHTRVLWETCQKPCLGHSDCHCSLLVWCRGLVYVQVTEWLLSQCSSTVDTNLVLHSGIRNGAGEPESRPSSDVVLYYSCSESVPLCESFLGKIWD